MTITFANHCELPVELVWVAQDCTPRHYAAIAPGSTLTGMTTMAYTRPPVEAGFLRHTPMGRFGQPEDIAQAILYLASPLSAWVTGHLLVVDGGQSLRGLPLYLENLLAT